MELQDMLAMFAAEDAAEREALRPTRSGRWQDDMRARQSAERKAEMARREANREAKRFPIEDAIDIFIDATPLV